LSFLSLFDFLNKKVDDAAIEATLQTMVTQLALKELAISIAVSYIAGALSKSEIKVYEKHMPVKDEWYYRLNFDPNYNENSSQFWYKIINKLIREGHSLVIQHNNKRIYCADTFNREENAFGEDKFTGITIGNKTINKSYKSSDVWYFRLEDKHIKTYVDAMYVQYGEAFDYAVNFFKNSNSKKYKLKMEPMHKVGTAEFNKEYESALKKQLADFLKPGNIVYPEFKGYDLVDFTPNKQVDSADIVALRKDIFETVATTFKMPSVMFSGNITNIKDVITSFITFGVDPFAEMITEELTRKTNTYTLWKSGSYVKVDTSKIEHIDIFSAAEKIDKLIACGVYSIDELREKLNENKLNTVFGQKHFITKNYIELEQALKGGDQN